MADPSPLDVALAQADRAQVGRGRRGSRLDGSFDTDHCSARRWGRHLLIQVPGQRDRLYDFDTAQMARYIFAQLTKAA